MARNDARRAIATWRLVAGSGSWSCFGTGPGAFAVVEAVVPTLSITCIAPAGGPTAGGTSVVITGAGFIGGAAPAA